MIAWSAITWDVARAGGFVAYGLVTLSVSLGLILSLMWRSPSWPRWATQDLHRYLALLALVFTALHTVAIWLDPFMHFTPVEVFVPFLTHYRPIWVALGILAAYLLLALYLSERLQKHIGYAWWRRLHYATFAVFLLATVHGLTSGSDTRTAWAVAIYAGSTLLVGGLLSVRLLRPSAYGTPHPRIAGMTGAAVAAIVIFSVVGPMRPGWNRIANAGPGSRGGVALGQPSSNRQLTVPFHATLSGTARESGGGFGSDEIQVTSDVHGGPQGKVLIAIDGSPTPNGFAVDGGRAELIPPSGRSCEGALSGSQGARLSFTCTDSAGTAINLVVDLQIDGRTQVSGTLDGTAG